MLFTYVCSSGIATRNETIQFVVAPPEESSPKNSFLMSLLHTFTLATSHCRSESLLQYRATDLSLVTYAPVMLFTCVSSSGIATKTKTILLYCCTTRGPKPKKLFSKIAFTLATSCCKSNSLLQYRANDLSLVTHLCTCNTFYLC